MNMHPDLMAALNALRPQIGTEIGVSDWITVDQAMVTQFGAVTRDDQWIHLDPDRAAAEAPFGGTILHGFLTLSLCSRFSYDCIPDPDGAVMGLNYGFDRLRFVAPVPTGSRLRGRFVLGDARARSETELLRVWKLTVEISGQETPALVADWLTLAVFPKV